jgi:hypothetical protein
MVPPEVVLLNRPHSCHATLATPVPNVERAVITLPVTFGYVASHWTRDDSVTRVVCEAANAVVPVPIAIAELALLNGVAAAVTAEAVRKSLPALVTGI